MGGFLHHQAQSIFQGCRQRLDFRLVEQAAVLSGRDGFEKDAAPCRAGEEARGTWPAETNEKYGSGVPRK
jgi:hypothetical protein